MIRGSAQSSKPIKSVCLYKHMIQKDVQPDNHTYPLVLKACTKLSWIHGKVVKNFWICEEKKLLGSYLMKLQANVKCGNMESARKLSDEVPQLDVVTWNAAVAGYVLAKFYEKASEMFEEMRIAREQTDEVTMLSLLSACTDSGSIDIEEKIHRFILKMGSRNSSVLLGNALVDMYAKCGGYIGKAIEVWNSITGRLAIHGFAKESIDLFVEMQREKTQPDEITFIGVLVACSHGGMTEKGRKYFELMRIQYGKEPNMRHYGCTVDMLGRAGLLEEAFEFAESIEIVPNPIIWRTSLGACRIHGNAELGKRASEQLLALRHDQSGDYVFLSNIYAAEGQWEGAENVRKLMEDRGVKKETGCTLIEADNKELMLFLLDTLCYTSKGDIDNIPSSFLKSDYSCGDWMEQKCRYPGNLVCY
ncbi:hypothetical protein MKW92_024372 [Papaver armeniacum]|nr:hypothetical protein MKW92_024372 [Papaver armeniacum]